MPEDAKNQKNTGNVGRTAWRAFEGIMETGLGWQKPAHGKKDWNKERKTERVQGKMALGPESKVYLVSSYCTAAKEKSREGPW